MTPTDTQTENPRTRQQALELARRCMATDYLAYAADSMEASGWQKDEDEAKYPPPKREGEDRRER